MSLFHLRGILKKSLDEFRPVHYLLYPEGKLVNDSTDPKLCSVLYALVDQAIEMVRSL